MLYALESGFLISFCEFSFSCSQFSNTDISFKAANDRVVFSQQTCVHSKYVQFFLSTCGLCAFKQGGGGCKYSLSCFEYLIRSSQGINDFSTLSILIFHLSFHILHT